MRELVAKKLKDLPVSPGVYFYKDDKGKIIYVGKAISLKNRVRQYFQLSRARDVKTDLLVDDIADLDWITVDSEIEALFLESEMIKRYLPKYNIDLRDDKHYQYVRIDSKSNHPTVQVTRRPLDDGAEYFGPYVGGGARPALKYLRRIFPFDWRIPADKKRASLDYHLNLSPGLEAGKTTLEQYRSNLRKLKMFLKGERIKLEKQLEVEMQAAAKQHNFELAARLRDQVWALNNLKKQIIFSDNELFDISKDQALNGLGELLGLKDLPRRIEGYDISHMSGTNNVASMVVFTNGVSDKREYRKFKMRLLGNDDFGHMREVMSRRFSGKNLEQWPKPDLILIDGGKGQVSAAKSILDAKMISIPLIGLAKRFEEIIIPSDNGQFIVTNLGLDSHITKLLQRIRDESHRFAVSYHSTLKVNRQTASLLEEIPGIGPATRKKLLKTFGSLRTLDQVSNEDIEKVIGIQKARLLLQYLKARKV